MVSIITGDVINSKTKEPVNWMPLLKRALKKYGNEPKEWEIYRGDSFQLEVSVEKALEAAILIKSTLKQIKGLDVRLAIGIGKKSFESNKITESNGSAFVNSGECFDSLKKSQIALRSGNSRLDIQMNLILDLAQLTMNNWTPKSAESIRIAIENPNLNQKELSQLLKKSPSTVNKGLKIAGYEEIMKLESYYREQIKTL